MLRGMEGDAPRALEGRLVRLRARERADLHRMNELFNDVEVRAGLTMVWPQPHAGIVEWFEATRGDPSTEVFAIETLELGDLVGACSLEGIDGRTRVAGFGIWIGRPFWGKGYGTDATRTICRFGFRFLNLHRVGLHVLATNLKAIHAYEKVGFRHEGTRRDAEMRGGRRVDLLVMGLLEDELE